MGVLVVQKVVRGGGRRGEDWERWCGEVNVGGTLDFLLS